VIGAVDGVGKGVIATTMILAMITGRPLLGEKVWRSGPVAIISYEDDETEWQRRIAAACMLHQVDYDFALDNIHFIRRKVGKLVFAQALGDRTLFPDSAAIISKLQEISAVMLLVDPFNSAHEMNDGNNNVLIARVAEEISRIAREGSVATLVLHHLRKGSNGLADDLMGATSLRANFRSGCRILARMTEKEAEDLSINAEDQFRFIRIAGTKENYAPPADKAKWYKLESLWLKNPAGIYEEGDNMGVATIWQPPGTFDGMSYGALKEIFEKLQSEPEPGWFYSLGARAAHRAVDVVMNVGGRSKAQAKQALEGWKKSGVLTEETYQTPSRNPSTKVVIDAVKVAAILASITPDL
jgi:hypothetical protein